MQSSLLKLEKKNLNIKGGVILCLNFVSLAGILFMMTPGASTNARSIIFGYITRIRYLVVKAILKKIRRDKYGCWRNSFIDT